MATIRWAPALDGDVVQAARPEAFRARFWHPVMAVAPSVNDTAPPPSLAATVAV